MKSWARMHQSVVVTTTEDCLWPQKFLRQQREVVALCVSHSTTTTKSLQSCPILCDPIDSSPPGSPIPGILQARTLEWVAIVYHDVFSSIFGFYALDAGSLLVVTTQKIVSRHYSQCPSRGRIILN